jgi:hypothetical protein
MDRIDVVTRRRTPGSATRSRSPCRTSRASTPTRTRCGRSPRRSVAAPPAWAAGRWRRRTRGTRRRTQRRADDVRVAARGHLQVLPRPRRGFAAADGTPCRYRNKRRAPQDPRVRLRGLVVGQPRQHRGRGLELLETDPAQAERFFGNRLVQGSGSWLPTACGIGARTLWRPDRLSRARASAAGSTGRSPTTGRRSGWRPARASGSPRATGPTRPTIWNPGEWGGKIPRDQVDAAWDEISTDGSA